MAQIKENNCNGCPDCIGCGRKYTYYEYFKCDICGYISDNASDFEQDNFGLDICRNCYEKEG